MNRGDDDGSVTTCQPRLISGGSIGLFAMELAAEARSGQDSSGFWSSQPNDEYNIINIS
jgi:hypothetical protein